MGSAMLTGWIKSGIKADNIRVIDPYTSPEGVKRFKTLNELDFFEPDYVVVAVKPQMLVDTLPALKKFKNAVFISIAAGKRIQLFKNILGTDKIVRAMPNLPALIGEGVTGIYAENLDDKQAEIGRLFNSLGKTVWLKSEDMVDSITAISGSGPAYVFLFIQSLIEAAQELGFEEIDAKNIATQTVLGSAKNVEYSTESAVILKENVTSKGGTTAAALSVLEDNNALKELVKEAAKAAFARSKELSE